MRHTTARSVPIIACLVLLAGARGLSASGNAPYTPPPGSVERKAIMESLRAGLRLFPESYSLDFQYKRGDVGVRGDFPIIFMVRHLKIKDGWAWAEVDVKDYCCASTHALLRKEETRWTVKALVNPMYAACEESGDDCILIQRYIYERIRKKFPTVPSDIFPNIDPELIKVLMDINDTSHSLAPGGFVYFVQEFRKKDGWAWLKAELRNGDGTAHFEPLACLVHHENGTWRVKASTPCCGECEEDPECAAGMYHRKIMRLFPSAPKEIFP
uniref:Uncharacterized protein n=1 Tax=Desulfacinum infernum TaxID=35837 RepID=A0A831ZRP8_9BACT